MGAQMKICWRWGKFPWKGNPCVCPGPLRTQSRVYSYYSFVSISLWIRGPQTGASGPSTFLRNWFFTGMQLCPWAYIWSCGFHCTMAALRSYHSDRGPWKRKTFTPWPGTEKVCGSPGSASGGFFTHLPMQKPQGTGIQSPGREDLLEEGAATHSSSLAWRIPWTEQPGGLPAIASHRAGHGWSDLACSAVSLTNLTWAGPAGAPAASRLILETWLVLPLQLSEQLPWWATALGWKAEWALMFPSRALASQMSQGLGVPKIPYSGPSQLLPM